MLTDELVKLSNKDNYNELWQESVPIVKHNLKRALQLHRDQTFMPTILKKVFTGSVHAKLPSNVQIFAIHKHTQNNLDMLEKIITEKVGL